MCFAGTGDRMVNDMKERFQNPIGRAIPLLRRIRLYPRLILLTLLCGILPLTVFSLFVLRTAQDTYMRNNYQNIQQCLELYTSLADEEMQKYTSSATKLASYTDTVRAITNSDASSLNQYVFLNSYKRYLGNVYISLGRLYSIEIVSLKKPILAISYSFTSGDVSENEAIQRAAASDETCFWQSVDSGSMWKGSAVQSIAAKRFLMLTVPVENNTSRQKIGYVNYFISDVLFSDLSKKIEKYQTFQTNQHYMDDILIVDRDNRIIFARDADRIGTLLPKSTAETVAEFDRLRDAEKGIDHMLFGSRNRNRDFVFCADSRQSDFRMVLTISSGIFMEASRRSSSMVVLFCILCIIFACGASVLFIASINRPINRLIRKMNTVDREMLDVTFQDRGNDEITVLTDNYNRMLQRMRRLFDKTVESEKKLQKAQYEALVTQINPHFLYNTLDMINWMAYTNGEEQISRAIENLSRFFRLSLKSNDENHTLDQELEHVKCYCAIQEERFGGKISYRFDIENDIRGCRMIRIILQPLVENAVIHGILPGRDGGTITISARRDHDMLLLSVADDGVGLQGKTPGELLRTGSGRQHGYGLANIDERVRLTYGSPYGLRIAENPEAGITVTVCIPADAGRGGDVVEHSAD